MYIKGNIWLGELLRIHEEVNSYVELQVKPSGKVYYINDFVHPLCWLLTKYESIRF